MLLPLSLISILFDFCQYSCYVSSFFQPCHYQARSCLGSFQRAGAAQLGTPHGRDRARWSRGWRGRQRAADQRNGQGFCLGVSQTWQPRMRIPLSAKPVSRRTKWEQSPADSLRPGARPSQSTCWTPWVITEPASGRCPHRTEFHGRELPPEGSGGVCTR